MYARLLRERALYAQVTGTQLPAAVVAAKFVSALAPPLRGALETAWGRMLGDFTVEQVREHALFYEERQVGRTVSDLDKSAKCRKTISPYPGSKAMNGSGSMAAAATEQSRVSPSRQPQGSSIHGGITAGNRCKYCSERGYKKADKHSDASQN
ncbi:hypothetical protein Pmar_PMAR021161 [Perkinsus marinus ATCC 50983]|uniref:Uncharacterized protein n=1 Tax=Perkinsus marinus (strain ATCC 50983 / TXsc) TaxID=423536 RepID=C5K932_PERM5|nr:hypothetical protein Pmar_PMAR021161 [Perkinsus marinus ATCC 50983]EER19011.1 hypothetical protein Pmar_PMAR021161 [Perkinsus marinus ATCC 50983]|eukprot:XP_002787215.1 hypothetical protein Pmar_PMAR021161 [Perkinsus marinus ATCC 50983]